VKYVFMDENHGLFKITTMSRVPQVSRSGYYRWRKCGGKPSARPLHRLTLDKWVKQVFEAGKGRNAAPRLALGLADAGHHSDHQTIAKNLRRQGLRAKAGRKFKSTTNSTHSLPVAPHLLKQGFVATVPNQKYVCDITDPWADEGWRYLAVVVDLYSRLVVGWAMSHRVTAQLVCDALQMGLWRRRMPTGVIAHSDRGSQYCSHIYRAWLQDNGLLCSMSRQDNGYDNACAESLFYSLKVEAIHGERFFTRAIMKQAVFDYIEVDYNRTRRPSANDFISPVLFEAQRVA